MIYKGILIVCDLDNTIVKDDGISDADAAAALAFTSQGGLLSVATGRIRDSAKRYVEALGVNCPVICQNGGYIYDYGKNEEYCSVLLDRRAYDITGEIIRMFKGIKVQVFSRQKIYFLGYDEFPGGPGRYKAAAQDLKSIPRPWAKVLFCASPDVLDSLRAKARLLDRKGGFDFVMSCEHYLEMLPRGVNKGTALLRLAELLGISRGMTIAIGDNENDIEMIRAAGCGIAVEGACPSLKSAADMVLSYPCGSALFGVVRMLKNGEITLKKG